MTESRTPQSHSVRNELHIARGFLAGLWRDLITGAFAYRPLPPLPATWSPLRRLPERLRTYARWAPHAAIAATAIVLMVITAEVEAVYWGHETDARFGALLVGVPLVTAISRPMGAWWLSIGGTVVIQLWGFSTATPWSVGGFVSHLLVMMLVAARTRPRVAAEMWLITTGVGLFFDLREHWEPSNAPAMIVVSLAALLAVVLQRGWIESRREVVKQVAVTRKERSQRTLLEERTTIARELHDVVAHHMSVVAIQAEAAPYRVADPPPELTKAFATIRENALIALSELRRVLGVVRASDYEAPDAPQPTLAALGGLLANVRDAGLTVEKTVTGAVRELPQGIEVSAYRIIQEALSNTMRHAPGAEARVEIAYVLGGLGLRVVNGPPRGLVKPSPGAGHGITGMRERVAMLNGEMTAGPTDDGGYETAVFVPVPFTEPRREPEPEPEPEREPEKT